MKIRRRFTQAGKGPYEGLRFSERSSKIVEPDGSVIFECDGVLVPECWSQVATDVLAQKYFRKAGVPARLRKIKEKGVPEWLWRSVADTSAMKELPEDERGAFLDAAANGDDRLVTEVRSLLGADQREGPLDELRERVVAPLVSQVRSVADLGRVGHHRATLSGGRRQAGNRGRVTDRRRYRDHARFATLTGAKTHYGWTDEGPDLAAMNRDGRAGFTWHA